MKKHFLFILSIVSGICIIFIPKEISMKVLNFLMTKEGVGIMTSIIGGWFALTINKSKNGEDLFKFDIKNNIEKMTNNIFKLNDSVQQLKHDFDEMKLGKATRENYGHQLNKVLITSINYFSIDNNLQSFIRFMAEDFKKFCVDIQEFDLKNIEYNDIKQSGILHSDMVKLKCIELLGHDFADIYHEFFLEDWKELMKKIKYILDDKVNNKNYRFFTTSVDYLQTSMSKSLQIWLEFNDKK